MSGLCSFWRWASSAFLVLALATHGGSAGGIAISVRSSRELALAFTIEPVSVIRVAVPFLNLTDSDWEGIQPLPVPLSVGRNLTLTGDPALPEWPMLVLWSRSKVLITNGATLTLKDVLLYRYKHDVGFEGAGLDLTAPTPPGGPPAYLVFQNVGTVLELCQPPSSITAIVNGSDRQRPEGLPGKQAIIANYTQEGCSNTSATLRQRCFATVTRIIQVAVKSTYRSSAGVPTDSNYFCLFYESRSYCLIIIPQSCFDTGGLIGCYAQLQAQYGRYYPNLLYEMHGDLYPGPTGPQLASPPETNGADTSAPSTQQAAVVEAQGGGDESASVVPVAVGVGVGVGVPLLIAAGVVAVLCVRRRRRQPNAEAAQGSGLGCKAGDSESGLGSSPETQGTSSASHAGQESSHGSAAVVLKPRCTCQSVPSEMSDIIVTSQTPFPEGLSTAARLEDTAPLDSMDGDLDAATTTDFGTQTGLVGTPLGANSQRTSPANSTSKTSDRKGASAQPDVVQLIPGGLLGKGAFGAVHEGTYRGHTVAVKLLLDATDMHCGATSVMKKMLTVELEILGRCRHPNVVRLLAACLDPPRPFIVLEKMETSLDKLLYGKGGAKPSKPLPFELVLKIAREIACGLEYLHPTVLHRDLKPANVLISDPWGPAPVVKLSDFGVSRLRASVLRTATPEAGTPAYLAPECFDISNPDLTHKADIWSFGTLLWECLAGEPPWWGLTIMEIAVNVTMRRVRLPLIPTHTPGGADPNRWPPRLVRLLGECLESDPLRRPAAAELVKRLALVQEGVDLAAADSQAGQAPADG